MSENICLTEELALVQSRNNETSIDLIIQARIEYRDINSSLHSCLATFLRCHLVEINTERAITMAAVDSDGLTTPELYSCLAKFGIRAQIFTGECFAKPGDWILALYPQSYFILLYCRAPSSFYVGVPGQNAHFQTRDSISGVLAHSERNFLIYFEKTPTVLSAPLRLPYLWCTIEEAVASGTLFELESSNRLSIQNIVDIHVAEMQPCEDRGVFRNIALSRGGIAFTHPELIVESLRNICRYANTKCVNDITFSDALKIFVDFLSIHPFRNGNGRVAKVLLEMLLGQSLKECWKMITRSQLYFWVNQAQRGQIEYLSNGILSAIEKSVAV